MSSIKDDRGYNQGFTLSEATRVRMNRRAQWMIQSMNPGVDADVLEIGCGTGELSLWIAEESGKRVLGTDLCVPFIEEAKQKYKRDNLQYAFLDFNKPEQFEYKQFDYIIGNGILHHLYYHLDEALVNIAERLKPNGRMIFMEPNIYNPYCALIFNIPVLRKLANLEPDEMAFSSSFIEKKLRKAGFKKVEVHYRDFLLPGIPEALIKPSIAVGNVLEKTPLLKAMAQSIFIVAEK